MAFPANRVFCCTSCGWKSIVFKSDCLPSITICPNCGKKTIILETKPIMVDFYSVFKDIFKK